jgi:cytoskeleton protein RodZ
VESFGAHLKREREQRKITLEDVSVSTKIGARFLIALEEEHFDQLPGGIFNKGFVRAYARHLGIDEEQAIADYLAASGANQPDPKAEEAPLLEARREEPSQFAARVPWGILAIALVAIAAGFTWWGYRTREKSAEPTVRVEPTVKVKAAPAAPPAGLKNASATLAVEPASPPAAVSSTQKTAAEPAVNGVRLASASSAVAPNPHRAAFVVSIKAREDSWISISADGKQIMQDILVAPVEKAVAARNQIVIKTGNAGGLDFSFNGTKLPLQGEYGEVKTLTFGANGLQAIPARAQPVSN